MKLKPFSNMVEQKVFIVAFKCVGFKFELYFWLALSAHIMSKQYYILVFPYDRWRKFCCEKICARKRHWCFSTVTASVREWWVVIDCDLKFQHEILLRWRLWWCVVFCLCILERTGCQSSPPFSPVWSWVYPPFVIKITRIWYWCRSWQR